MKTLVAFMTRKRKAPKACVWLKENMFNIFLNVWLLGITSKFVYCIYLRIVGGV